jgi:hypothetical protein
LTGKLTATTLDAVPASLKLFKNLEQQGHTEYERGDPPKHPILCWLLVIYQKRFEPWHI